MHITAAKAQLTAHDVKIAGAPNVMELRIDADEVVVGGSSDGCLWIRSAAGSIVITESSVNDALSQIRVDRIRDLDLKTYNEFIRISGRHELLGAVSVKFSITAAPEIESGARLKIAVRDVNVAGALPMPAFVVNLLAAKINEQIGKVFDVTRLPIPLRLTGVRVDPGRLTLLASLDMPEPSAQNDDPDTGNFPSKSLEP